MNRMVLSGAGLSLALVLGCAPAATTFDTTAGSLDRSVMPPAGPEPEVDFPAIQRTTLSNGLALWVVERPHVPLVTAQLLLEAGAVADPENRSGLASLTADMLTEGTTTRSATDIADEIDFLAANLSAGVGRETAVVTLSTLSRNLEAALELFTDVIANPAFEEREWERVREQRIVSLIQTRDQPAAIASQEFARIVYGTEHPYGRPVQGTTESVTAISTDELRGFHETYYRPDGATLIVVGDVQMAVLVEQLERHFAGWRGAVPPSVEATIDPPPLPTTRIYLVDKPGAAQSQIRIGHVGVERAHRDYFPLIVLNAILGGQFSSRINLNLREDKGYTYGASSAFQMGRIAGPFVTGAGVQTAVTMESVVEFMRELEEIRSQRPATAEEVDFAKTSIIRQEPLTLQTNAQIASRLQELVRYDLPLDYFDEYGARIEEVAIGDVHRVAREHLRPGEFAIVVVGDQARIEDDLRTLDYPIEIVAVQDRAEPVTERPDPIP